MNYKGFNEHYIKDELVVIKIKNEDCLIDKKDLSLVNAHRWCLLNGYAISPIGIYLHRLIVGRPPKGLVIDHINRNKLDNRRVNLRIVTNKVNTRNLNCRNKHGHASIQKRCGNYRVRINVDGKEKNLGTYKNVIDAIEARKNAEIKYWV